MTLARTSPAQSSDAPLLDGPALWPAQAHTPTVLGRQLVIDRGEGSYVYTTDGRRLFDGTAGLWHANIGHAHPELAQAAYEQMLRLATFHIFARFTNDKALALGERLAAIAPIERAKVILNSGGSDAIDVACKLARRDVEPAHILVAARRSAGLSQDELAKRAGTSRPTLSSYEHGHRSPTLQTAARILGAAGFTLDAVPIITFAEHRTERGRPIPLPSRLPRLEPARALANVALPLHLNWSEPGRRFDLRDRRQRARVYEIVLREGTADDVLTYIDGVLLVELWDDLFLPRRVRAAWAPLIEQYALGSGSRST
jgi:transcriptional regulator with XRE-family HTH domain